MLFYRTGTPYTLTFSEIVHCSSKVACGFVSFTFLHVFSTILNQLLNVSLLFLANKFTRQYSKQLQCEMYIFIAWWCNMCV